jgi:hypothetical protein
MYFEPKANEVIQLQFGIKRGLVQGNQSLLNQLGVQCGVGHGALLNHSDESEHAII